MQHPINTTAVKFCSRTAITLAILATAAAATSFAAVVTSLIRNDAVSDVHLEGEKCEKVSQSAREIDIRQVVVSNDATNLYVTMEVRGPVAANSDFREFYFWIDVNNGKGVGYVPYEPSTSYAAAYNPTYQAWTNFYADFRVYLSIDEEQQQTKLFQECAVDQCAGEPNGSYKSSLFSVSITGSEQVKNLVKFAIPFTSLKINSSTKQTIQLGFTTYFERQIGCNQSGEDDYPDWSEPALSYTIQ